MYDADARDRVTVTPPLDPAEVRLVGGLAGAGDGPRRLWPGQPGRRSPWAPCDDGCCLVLVSGWRTRSSDDPVEWLRFLIREVLAARAAGARSRAALHGLPGGHSVSGRVFVDLDGMRTRVVVNGNRVRETEVGQRADR